MEDYPLVSMVIPTYNSEKFIELCLHSTKNQTYKNIEIIIVDKGSKDYTISIAKKYTDKVFVVPAKERSEQKNYGAKKAKGKYLYFVDSDFILEPTVIEEAVSECENHDYDAVCVHNTSDPTISFWSKVRKLERDCYENDELNVAARFVRKDVFEAIGGFDEELIAGEDYDFHNRLLKAGYKVGRIKAKETHIGEPKSIWEIAKKHYYYGKTLPNFLKKNKERGIRQLSPIRPSYLRHWKKFVRQPVLTVGFVIYQIVRYMSAGTGYLVGKVKNKLEANQ